RPVHGGTPDPGARAGPEGAAPADQAGVADAQPGARPEVMAGHDARRQRDQRADQRALAHRYPALAEDRACRERHDRSAAELPERPPCGRVRGHPPGPLEFLPGPVHGPRDQRPPGSRDPPADRPQALAGRRAAQPAPARHQGIPSRLGPSPAITPPRWWWTRWWWTRWWWMRLAWPAKRGGVMAALRQPPIQPGT